MFCTLFFFCLPVCCIQHSNPPTHTHTHTQAGAHIYECGGAVHMAGDVHVRGSPCVGHMITSATRSRGTCGWTVEVDYYDCRRMDVYWNKQLNTTNKRNNLFLYNFLYFNVTKCDVLLSAGDRPHIVSIKCPLKNPQASRDHMCLTALYCTYIYQSLSCN